MGVCMRNFSTLFFPFSPGIPWKMKYGIYVHPELPMSCFMDILKTRQAIVAGFGGFVESFYSLSILETINHLSPHTQLFWCGNKIYHHLLEINGLSKSYNDITKFDLDRFPTPIFLDQDNGAYFNYLNNYMNVYTYYLKHGYRDRRPILQQLLENSTVKWDVRHLPKLRYFKKPDGLNHYLRMYKLHINGPFVLLFPDGGEYSMHNVNCLQLDIHQIRSIAAILQQHNIPLILMTNNVNRYTYSQAKIFPLRIDFATYLIKKATAVLSKNIDFLLVSLAISDAKVISITHKHEYNLSKNLHFIGSNNVIYANDTLNPVKVCDFILEN